MLRLAIGAPPQGAGAATAMRTAGGASLPEPRPRSSAAGGRPASAQQGRHGIGAQLPARLGSTDSQVPEHYGPDPHRR